MKKFRISALSSNEVHVVRFRTLKEVQKWRDENLCKYTNWCIQVL